MEKVEEREKVLKRFRSYLRGLGRRPQTVRGYVTQANRFMLWLEKERLTLSSLSYGEVLKWIGYEQGRGQSTRVINQNIGILRQLFASEGYESPIEELRLRGQRHKVVSSLLSMEEMEGIYECYDRGGLTGKRNKVIIGLLIWQGLRKVELEGLRGEDVDLERGLIRIRETANANSRILDLQGGQLLDLQDYVQLVRPVLNKEGSDRLLVSRGSGKKLSNALGLLMQQCRSYQSKLRTAMQLRQSLITHWLRHYDLRTVQYMAGHRYVSSTHRYQNRDLENLQERIEEVHPLNKV